MEMERNGGSSKSSSEGHPLTVREYESKKDKCENITVTDQSKVKRRHITRLCFSSEEEKNKSTHLSFHFCRPDNGITIEK